MTAQQQVSEHRVVVGTDGSKASMGAVRWAARQAELTGAQLEVVMAWEWPSSYGWVPAVPSDYDPAGDSQRMLDEALSTVRTEHPALDIRPVVVEGHPAPALIHASEGADLLVVGSRGHGEFVGMLIGSVSKHCVSTARCPVVVMRS